MDLTAADPCQPPKLAEYAALLSHTHASTFQAKGAKTALSEYVAALASQSVSQKARGGTLAIPNGFTAKTPSAGPETAGDFCVVFSARLWRAKAMSVRTASVRLRSLQRPQTTRRRLVAAAKQRAATSAPRASAATTRSRPRQPPNIADGFAFIHIPADYHLKDHHTRGHSKSCALRMESRMPYEYSRSISPPTACNR